MFVLYISDEVIDEGIEGWIRDTESDYYKGYCLFISLCPAQDSRSQIVTDLTSSAICVHSCLYTLYFPTPIWY